MCNLFTIMWYVPHRGRTKAPYAQDIIKQLQELLATVNKMDCVILMGDFNCEFQRNVKGCTGQWCMNQRKDNGHGEEMLAMMRSFDLFAVDTLFKPKKKEWGQDKKMRYCNTQHTWRKTQRRDRGS